MNKIVFHRNASCVKKDLNGEKQFLYLLQIVVSPFPGDVLAFKLISFHFAIQIVILGKPCIRVNLVSKKQIVIPVNKGRFGFETLLVK